MTLITPKSTLTEQERERLPPGQHLTRKWPVLTFGAVPKIDLRTWQFKAFGQVDQPQVWTWEQFRELGPTVEVVSDFHCVTHWSRLDNRWTGIRARDVLAHMRPRLSASQVMVHAIGGYTTNLPLAALVDDDVLFAWAHDGEPLTPEHGAPLRLVVPKRYAWKSAKWVNGLELIQESQPGFWEKYGYHNDADPWQEQRYSGG
jgi:DMSO/TMAO reductase YedYZ molybdopterin-dependent catalytic subunit